MRIARQLALIAACCPIWIPQPVVAQFHIFLLDSVHISTQEVPLLGAQVDSGFRLHLNEHKLIHWHGDNSTAYDLTQKLPAIAVRAIVPDAEMRFALDYPDHILALDLKSGKQQAYRIKTFLDGIEYDIFTPSVDAGLYLPELEALAFAIVPMGTLEKNLFNSLDLYREAPLMGLFRLKGRKAELFRVIGQRDSIFWTRNGLLDYVLFVNAARHPDKQSFYVSQNPIARIERYDAEGKLLGAFGTEARYGSEDTLIAIPPALYTQRRSTVYGIWATKYLDMYVDAAHQRLYRRYYIGKPLPVAPDSLEKPDPQRPPQVCWFDPYLDSILGAMPPDQFGLQVYDLSGESPVLLHDLLLPRRMKLLHADGDRLTFGIRKEDGYWLYQGVIVPDEASPSGR